MNGTFGFRGTKVEDHWNKQHSLYSLQLFWSHLFEFIHLFSLVIFHNLFHSPLSVFISIVERSVPKRVFPFFIRITTFFPPLTILWDDSEFTHLLPHHSLTVSSIQQKTYYPLPILQGVNFILSYRSTFRKMLVKLTNGLRLHSGDWLYKNV